MLTSSARLQRRRSVGRRQSLDELGEIVVGGALLRVRQADAGLRLLADEPELHRGLRRHEVAARLARRDHETHTHMGEPI